MRTGWLMHTVKVNGWKIRELRRGLNLTQEELADRTGCARGYISQIENRNIDTMSEYTAVCFTIVLRVKDISELAGLSQREQDTGDGDSVLHEYKETLLSGRIMSYAEFMAEKDRERELK